MPRRRTLRLVRFWTIILLVPLAFGYWGVRHFLTTATMTTSGVKRGWVAEAIGDSFGGGLILQSTRWGSDPYWRHSSILTLEELVCAELANGIVRDFRTTSFDVLDIPEPFTLSLRDQASGEVTQRYLPLSDPQIDTLNITWSPDGLRLNPHPTGWDYFAPGVRYDTSATLSLIGRTILNGFLTIVLIGMLVVILTAESIWIRAEWWHCPKCGFDLREQRLHTQEDSPEGWKNACCPECGWGRGE